MTASPMVLASRTGRVDDLGRALGELLGDLRELRRRHVLAEVGEPDQVGEAHRHLLRALQPARRGLLDGDGVGADAVREGHRDEVGEVQRVLLGEPPGLDRVAQGRLRLGLAGREQRLPDQRAERVGHVEHAAADRADHRHHVLVGEPEAAVALDALGDLGVLVGVDRLVGVRGHRAARARGTTSRRSRGPARCARRSRSSTSRPRGRACARAAAGPAGRASMASRIVSMPTPSRGQRVQHVDPGAAFGRPVEPVEEPGAVVLGLRHRRAQAARDRQGAQVAGRHGVIVTQTAGDGSRDGPRWPPGRRTRVIS